MRTPPIVDAPFTLVEHRFRVRWGVLLFCLAYVGVWAAVAFHARDPALQAVCVVVAGLWYPLLAFVAQLGEKVTHAQAEALRWRMDPRRPWRKRAISDLRR